MKSVVCALAFAALEPAKVPVANGVSEVLDTGKLIGTEWGNYVLTRLRSKGASESTSMPNLSGNIAVVFDFDDTLMPDSTSALLAAHGMNPQRFWTEQAKALIDRGFDPAPAYLNLLLDNVGEGKPFGHLTNDSLKQFGGTLDDKFYPGVPQLFTDLRDQVKQHRDIHIEFYVVSGGLQAVMEGSRVVKENFAAVYGSQLGPCDESGSLKYIQRCITFTEKTRYIFEINKGVEPKQTLGNPHLVNQKVDPEVRRVPLTNMIYIGDGLTDIPCFSLVKQSGGTTLGVFDPSKEASARRALQEFLKTDRVEGMYAPRYGPTDDLGSMLRAAVAQICSQIAFRRSHAREW